MDAKHKNFFIGGLLALVFIMALGYAAFVMQLNINSITNFTSNWDVHIKSIAVGVPVGTASNKMAHVVEGKSLEAEFETNVSSPGDSVTYTVEVENSGTLYAKLDEIILTQLQKNTENKVNKDNRNIIYSYDGIAKGDVLEPGEIKEFTVKVEFNPTVKDNLAEIDKTSVLNMRLNYIQKTSENNE